MTPFPRRSFLGSLASLALVPIGRLFRKPETPRRVMYEVPPEEADAFVDVLAVDVKTARGRIVGFGMVPILGDYVRYTPVEFVDGEWRDVPQPLATGCPIALFDPSRQSFEVGMVVAIRSNVVAGRID